MKKTNWLRRVECKNIDVLFFGVSLFCLGLLIGINVFSIPNMIPETEPIVYDYRGFTAGTGSMLPAIPADAEVLYVFPGKELFVGDIVAYHDPRNYTHIVLHRIIYVADDGYITKGDYNLYADPYSITRDDIIYRVVGVLYG